MKKILLVSVLMVIPFYLYSTVFSVTNLNDAGAGSLREAMTQANADYNNSHTINITVNGTITLASRLPDIICPLTINGQGMHNTILEANALPGVATYRVFTIPCSTVTIKNMTIRHGRQFHPTQTFDTSSCGGAIYYRHNPGTLTLENVDIVDNEVETTNGYRDAKGGAIYISGGHLVIINSMIRNNKAIGLYNCTGTNGGALGGGIFIGSGSSAYIEYSTISGDSAIGRSEPGIAGYSAGGGICIEEETAVRILNSTITNNHAWVAVSNVEVLGGGIFSKLTDPNSHPTWYFIHIDFSTISHNTAASGGSDNYGGGIFSNYSGSDINFSPAIKNTIIANNSATSGSDVYNSIESRGYNLILNTTDGNIITTGGANTNTGNIFGQDPLLGALQDNGGPTYTRAIAVNSPAINMGNNTDIDGNVINDDQRHYLRGGGTTPSLGAYDFPPPPIPSLPVWGLIILVALFIGSSIIYLKKYRLA